MARKKQVKVSACMIVRDGESTIRNALSSVIGYVDEIVVAIDSRTVDATRDIVSEYADKVFEYDWVDDFAYARNLVASKASNDMVLVIDADDSMEEGKEKEFRKALKDNVVISFNIQVSKNASLRSVRCYNRNTASYMYKVHEYLKFHGPATLVDLQITITHEKGLCIEPGRNLRILDGLMTEYPRYLFYHGRESYDTGLYEDAIKSFETYLPRSVWNAEKCDAYMGIAKAWAALKDYEKARRACFEVLLLDGNYITAYNYLGQICSVLGEFRQSIIWYEAALRCGETAYVFNEVKDIEFNCYGNLILSYHRCGMINEARNALIQAERIDNENNWIKNQIKLTKLDKEDIKDDVPK